MADHTFCRLMLKQTRQDLTAEQRKRLKGAWSYMYGGRDQGEFQVTKENFYWYGSAHCAYEARAKGIMAWLNKNYPEQE